MGASASREKFIGATDRLTTEEVKGDDVEFWDELWKLGSSSEEVFSVLSPTSIRLLRRSHFSNLSTLITQATAQLCQVVETPYSIYFDQALNCVRVLTRLLPFVMEDIADSEGRSEGGLKDTEALEAMVEELCWGEGDGSIGRMEEGEKENSFREPIGLLVVHAAMHMLFLPQFTCDYFEEPDEDEDEDEDEDNEGETPTPPNPAPSSSPITPPEIPPSSSQHSLHSLHSTSSNKPFPLTPTTSSVIWAYGPGVHTSGITSSQTIENPAYLRNRIEVLRLLLTSCSSVLFKMKTNNNNEDEISRWTGTATGIDAPKATELFYSLLNTIMSYNPNKGVVPYAGVFGSEVKRELIELSVQVLIVLLDFGLPGVEATVVDEDDGDGGKEKVGVKEGEIKVTETSKDKEKKSKKKEIKKVLDMGEGMKEGFNVFRTLARNMEGEYEFNFIFQGFSNILNSVHLSVNTYLPGSMRGAAFYQETLVLLWKFLEENKKFQNFIIDKADVNELVVPICYLMYSSCTESTNVGLIHMCGFLLLKLSGSRDFCICLNRPFKTHLPIDLPLFTGTHADLMAITIQKVISSGTPNLAPLYGCMVTTISNISPYWRSLSLTASLKIVNLLEIFTSMKKLYGPESHENIGFAALILEVFNNVIQYQFTGNEQLIYAIVRKKAVFLKMINLKPETASANWHKVNKKEEATGEASARHNTSEAKSPQSDTAAAPPPDVVPTGVAPPPPPPPTPPGAQVAVEGNASPPDAEWVENLKKRLPLDTVSRLLKSLLPLIDNMVQGRDGVVDEEDILEFLRNTTLVGLLPVPHPIVIRQYQPNEWTGNWFTSYLWGVIFLRNQKLPIFDGDSIKLFHVRTVEG